VQQDAETQHIHWRTDGGLEAICPVDFKLFVYNLFIDASVAQGTQCRDEW
jgi:hypothetical protein